MIEHHIKVHPSAAALAREDQLAWKIAEFACARPPVESEVTDMIACRIVDNAGVALASLGRKPVDAAMAMAMAHPRAGGATLMGLPRETRVHAEWAAWANATAVRELDYHDTFLAADYAHPGDNIPPLIAVAQQCGLGGEAVARAIAAAYEVHVALVKGICLHEHKKDHAAHLAPATVAGLGALLDLPADVVYNAVNQAVHLSFSTRQSRKGEISSWKAFVPGQAGKTAVEAVDRAMRGEGAPNPVYEGEDSVIAWMLGGPETEYTVSLPARGEPPRAILETYTKAHSAEYQAQAIIDLAIEMHKKINVSEVRQVRLHTSHHTHHVIGTGSGDPQKQDPQASRETLDHSITYILAVALEDGRWHHVDSYTPERAARRSTAALWQSIETVEDPAWTERYHHPDSAKRAFGGRLEIKLQDGSLIEGEKAVADAHPNGTTPWGWDDYVAKFDSLTNDLIAPAERQCFLDDARAVSSLDKARVLGLNPCLIDGAAQATWATGNGIFDWPD